jgi:hypothetical protein
LGGGYVVAWGELPFGPNESGAPVKPARSRWWKSTTVKE